MALICSFCYLRAQSAVVFHDEVVSAGHRCCTFNARPSATPALEHFGGRVHRKCRRPPSNLPPVDLCIRLLLCKTQFRRNKVGI
jgi:hypothetical protein